MLYETHHKKKNKDPTRVVLVKILDPTNIPIFNSGPNLDAAVQSTTILNIQKSVQNYNE